MLPFIADALGVCEQEFFTSDSKQSQKILKRIYDKEDLSYKYRNIIELLEYLSPKSLEILEKTLMQNKSKIEELNQILGKIIN